MFDCEICKTRHSENPEICKRNRDKALKKSMDSGELYNDYEASIEAARIMEDWGELKIAKDVFDFIDHTVRYDKVMKQFIDETLEEYDYEAKEEVAKE